MHKYVQSMVGEQLKLALSDPEIAARILRETPQKRQGLEGKSRSMLNVKKVIANVKSPSDTTIYAPALNLTPEKVKKVCPEDKIPSVTTDQDIIKFLKTIRLNTDDELTAIAEEVTNQEPQPSTSHDGRNKARPEAVTNWKEDAREFTDQYNSDANANKASLEPPTGKQVLTGKVKYSDVVDDEFFHITCHVDSGLHEKIEAGKFRRA